MVFTTMNGRNTRTGQGFTFIEIVMVLVVISLLISIALPNYFTGLKHSKEAVLKADLKVMRKAIDDYHADKGHYPKQLQALVTQRYIHAIPEDPITDSAETWLFVSPPDHSRQIYDIRSGSDRISSDGTPYQSW